MWVLCDRPPIKELDQGPRHAARRRRASDAAVSRAGRQHGAGGRGRASPSRSSQNGDDYAAAFKSYQQLRYLRTARVQLMARVFGEIYHASGVNRELRNKVLSDWTAQGGVDMSWLYGHQPGICRASNA